MRVMMRDEDENEDEGLLIIKGLAFGFGCARGESSSNRTKAMSRVEQKTTTLSRGGGLVNRAAYSVEETSSARSFKALQFVTVSTSKLPTLQNLPMSTLIGSYTNDESLLLHRSQDAFTLTKRNT